MFLVGTQTTGRHISKVFIHLFKGLCPQKAVPLIPHISYTQSAGAPLQMDECVDVHCLTLKSVLATFLPGLKPWARLVQLQPACSPSGAGRPCNDISGVLAVEAAAAQVGVVLKSNTAAVLL